MSHIRSKRPKSLLFLEYLLYRSFESLLQYFPPTWVDHIGITLGWAAFHLMSSRRAIVERNIRIAWGDSLNRRDCRTLTRQVFLNNGANLLGSTRSMVMDDATLQKHFTLEGADLVRTQLARQEKGAIFTLCHMGNWEMLARIAHLIAPGVAAGAFYRPLNNPWMNHMTKRRRQRSGTKLFSNKEGLSQATPLLRSGGILGILADQHAGRNANLCTFFGRPTTCTPLVELLHRRTGASIFHISIVRDAPAHWIIKIRKHPSRETQHTPAIMNQIERSLSESPADGFWFHNRWKLAKRHPLHPTHARSSLDVTQITKPWRWVFAESADPAIAAAARPAMEFAMKQAQLCHIDVLRFHPASINHTLSHVTERIAATDRLTQMLQLDQESTNPLDLMVLFGQPHEWPVKQLRKLVPDIAAIVAQKNRVITHGIIIDRPMTEPATWWDFIEQLGIKRTAKDDIS